MNFNLIKRKIVLYPLCLIGIIFFLIVGVDWEKQEANLEIETKFPLPDYLYKNSSFKKEQNLSQADQNKAIQEEIKEEPKDEFMATEEELKKLGERIKKELNQLKLAQNHQDSKDKKEKFWNFNFLKQGQRVKQPNELTAQKGKNDRFVWDKANKKEQEQISILASRIVGFESQGSEEEIDKEYGVDSFSNFDKQDHGSNEHKLLRTITADKNIPAVLITPISSSLSGKVIAQTETDIYGSMGRAKLIPKGSKVIGYYNNNNKIGEYRLQIAWTRIITPQGIHILLSDARGADVKGYSGLIGEVISRNFEKYGMPLLVSTLSNGLLMTASTYLSKEAGESGNIYSQYALTELSNTMKNDVSAVVEQIIRDKANINPIIIIREGSRVFISPNTDIFIPIPKKKEVLAQFFKEPKPQDEEGGIGDE